MVRLRALVWLLVLPDLSGQIVDATGSVLPRVSIQVTSTDRKTTQTTISDRSGGYQFVGLPPGPSA